jgi:hypothetical protein
LEQLFDILLSIQQGTARHGEWVVTCLQGAWSRLIGDRLAAVCRLALFRDSELVVEIVDKDWEEAIRSVQPELLDKLRTATAGEVNALSLTLGK